MVEAYAAQQLQIPTPDLEWKSWAAGLLAIDVFVNEAIPDPYQYEEKLIETILPNWKKNMLATHTYNEIEGWCFIDYQQKNRKY